MPLHSAEGQTVTALSATSFSGTYVQATSGSFQGVLGVGAASGANDAVNTAILGRAGFSNRTDSILSIATGTQTATVGTTGSFEVWTANTRFVFGGPQSTTWGTASGDWFVYFNNVGVLTSSQTPWDIASDQVAPAMLVYWDGIASGTAGDERHDAKRNRPLHKYLHDTRGTQYGGGLSSSYTNTTFAIASGTIWDEDIQITVPANTTARVWFRVTGTAGLSMSFFENQTKPYYDIAGIMQFDNTGTFVPVSSNFYVCNWVFATDEISSSIAIVNSQAQYLTAQAASQAPVPDFANHNTREWRLIDSVVYQQVGSTPTFISKIDWRDHDLLPGTQQLAQVPAPSVTYVPSTPLTSTNVQGALDQLANRSNSVFGGLYMGLPAASGGTGDPTFTVASGVFTAVSTSLTAALSDVNGLCSATIQNGQVTVNADGLYRVTAAITCEVNNATRLYVGLFITGTEHPRFQGASDIGANNSNQYVISALTNLVSGNFVDFRVQPGGGSVLTMRRFNMDVLRVGVSGS